MINFRSSTFGGLLKTPHLESRIIGYLCKQLDLPIVGTVEAPQRDATRTEYKKIIFEHLQFLKFEDALDIFKHWLKSKVAEGFILTEQVGRLLKTEYILRYITDSDLRDKVQRQLNKGEHRHSLSRWIFFANNGKFQVGDYEEIMNKASCLSLVSNAVLYWNTIKITEIVNQLRANGEKISDKTLSHISLLLQGHVIPMGTYFVNDEVEQSIRQILE